MKYIFDDIFQIYFKNICTLFVCDIHSHLRYVYIPKLPQYNYTYVLTLFILKTDLFCVTKWRRGKKSEQSHSAAVISQSAAVAVVILQLNLT